MKRLKNTYSKKTHYGKEKAESRTKARIANNNDVKVSKSWGQGW